MRITVNGIDYEAVRDATAGTGVAEMMRQWDDVKWHWWAYSLKRFGLGDKASEALARWDYDNSTGVVSRVGNNQ